MSLDTKRRPPGEDKGDVGTEKLKSFEEAQDHLIRNVEKLRSTGHMEFSFTDEFDSDEVLDRFDISDDNYYMRRYYHSNYKQSIVFQQEVYVPDILDYYEDVQERMTPLTSDNGVFKRIIQKGDGTSPSPDVEIFIHYNAFMEGNDDAFDASIMRQEHQVFRLKDKSVFTGLQLAIQSMEYDEVAQFIFQPKYFYGDVGCLPRIPGGCPAMFFIELVNLKAVKTEKEMHQMSPEQLKDVPFQDFIDEVEEINEAAKKKYKLKLYEEAILRYELGLKVIRKYYFTSTLAEEKRKEELLMKLLGNTSQCYFMIKDYKRVLKICKQALRNGMPPPINAKFYFRYTKVLLLLKEDMDLALSIVTRGIILEPHNQALRELKKQVLQAM